MRKSIRQQSGKAGCEARPGDSCRSKPLFQEAATRPNVGHSKSPLGRPKAVTRIEVSSHVAWRDVRERQIGKAPPDIFLVDEIKWQFGWISDHPKRHAAYSTRPSKHLPSQLWFCFDNRGEVWLVWHRLAGTFVIVQCNTSAVCKSLANVVSSLAFGLSN